MRSVIRMMFALVALGACSHDRVVVTLAGDAPGATEIEIVVAEPYASKRLQRADGTRPTIGGVEDAFYIAQRATTRFAIDPAQPLAGTQLQLELPDREPFLPIAIARDAGGRIVGMGAYLVDEAYLDGITPSAKLLADVTFYDVVIEPVHERADGTTGVAPSEVAIITCEGAPSGYAWRRGGVDDAKPQLRIVLPLDDPEGSAIDRLDTAVDLDCDGHSPGVGGLAARDDGDKLDCDDIDQGTSPEALEACNGRDDNCDGRLDGLSVTSGSCPNVPPGCPNLQLCDESIGEICPGQNVGCSGGLVCLVPFLPTSETTMKACNSTTGVFEGIDMQFNPCAEGGCQITLVAVDDRWDVRIGDPGNPANGPFEPYMAAPGQAVGIRATSSEEFTINENTGSFTVFVRTAGGSSILATFRLDMTQNKSLSGCQNDPMYRCGGNSLP